MLVKGDDRGDRGEAHLEARPGQRFGPEQEHDERGDRDQPQGQRLAPQRDPEQDEQGGDARADRRHLGAGEQRVGDSGERPGAGGDQHQPEAQRQRRAEREQLQREQHHRSDHRGEVEAADREQVGEAGAAHRFGVRFGNPALVAGGQRGGDPAGAAGEPGADMVGEALAGVGEPGPPALLAGGRDQPDDGDPAGAADPLEPGGAGEIVGARAPRPAPAASASRAAAPSLRPRGRPAPWPSRH